MNHFVFSAFLDFFFTLISGTYFLLGKRNKTQRWFGIFWLVIAFWAFFVGFQEKLLEIMPGHLWGFFLHVGCIFVPIVFLHFAFFLTGWHDRFSLALKIAYGLGFAFLVLILVTNWFTAETIYRDFYAYPKPSILYPIYILLFQTIAFGTLFLLFRWRNTLPMEVQRFFQLFIVVHVLAYIGSMDNYLIMYDLRISPLYPYGLYLIIPYSVLGSYAMAKLLKVKQTS